MVLAYHTERLTLIITCGLSASIPWILCSALLVSFPWAFHFPLLPKLNRDLIHSIIYFSSAIIILSETENNHSNIIINGFLVSKKTVVLQFSGRVKQKLFFLKLVD